MRFCLGSCGKFVFFFHLFGAGQHQPKRHFQPKIVVKAFYLLLCLMYIYFVHTHAQPEWLVVAHTVHLRVDRRSAYDLRLRHYNYYNILPIEVAIVVYAACCLSFCWHFARVEFGYDFFAHFLIFFFFAHLSLRKTHLPSDAYRIRASSVSRIESIESYSHSHWGRRQLRHECAVVNKLTALLVLCWVISQKKK